MHVCASVAKQQIHASYMKTVDLQNKQNLLDKPSGKLSQQLLLVSFFTFHIFIFFVFCIFSTTTPMLCVNAQPNFFVPHFFFLTLWC